MPFTLAIVGRPNVGKSTLFNRLTGTQHALVDDRPGVTRDWREGEGHIASMSFRLIDTAGMEESDTEDGLENRMRQQTEDAIMAADVILFLLDAKDGVTPYDQIIAEELRRSDRPVVLAMNKCDGFNVEMLIAEAWSLGLGQPLALSAAHGHGLADLFDSLLPYESQVQEEGAPQFAEEAKQLQIAIIGRPNAGKSTLMNALLGSNRVLTGPEAGITRDAIAVPYHYQDRHLTLIDTAGVRRRTHVREDLEKLAVHDAFRALRFAHVAVMMMDASEPFSKQDMTILQHVVDEGRAIVIAINKWDTVTDTKTYLKGLEDAIDEALPQIKGVPVVTLSALKKQKVDDVLKAAIRAFDVWNRRVPTAKLNEFLQDMLIMHPPPMAGNNRLRIRYMTQVNTRPPSFVLFVSKPDQLPDSYRRYLLNGLREQFDMPGVPVRLMLRKNENPYVKKTSAPQGGKKKNRR